MNTLSVHFDLDKPVIQLDCKPRDVDEHEWVFAKFDGSRTYGDCVGEVSLRTAELVHHTVEKASRGTALAPWTSEKALKAHKVYWRQGGKDMSRRRGDLTWDAYKGLVKEIERIWCEVWPTKKGRQGGRVQMIRWQRTGRDSSLLEIEGGAFAPSTSRIDDRVIGGSGGGEVTFKISVNGQAARGPVNAASVNGPGSDAASYDPRSDTATLSGSTNQTQPGYSDKFDSDFNSMMSRCSIGEERERGHAGQSALARSISGSVLGHSYRSFIDKWHRSSSRNSSRGL